jgi:hypothetical protein
MTTLCAEAGTDSEEDASDVVAPNVQSGSVVDPDDAKVGEEEYVGGLFV